jgi:hypothetical protein
MSGEMSLYLKDVYPNMGGIETSDVTPDADIQATIQDDSNLAEKHTDTTGNKTNIIMAIG